MVGETSTSAIKMNFNRILKVTFKEDNINTGYQDLVDFFERLSKYSPGNKNIPHEGFCDMEESNKIKFVIPKSDSSNFNDNNEVYSQMSVKSILCKTFRYETYFENKNEAQIREADIFLIKESRLLFIKGSDEACNKIQNYLDKCEVAEFIKVMFSHHFLLWMLNKFSKHEVLNNLLDIKKIKKGRTQGSDSNENDINSTDIDSRDIPLTTIYGLLNNHNLSYLAAVFKYSFNPESRFYAKVEQTRGIFIYADHALKGKDYVEKCNLSFPFLIAMVNLFDYWQSLDDESKYPDDNFFNLIEKSFDKQVQNAKEGFEDLKKQYNNLRCGLDE